MSVNTTKKIDIIAIRKNKSKSLAETHPDIASEWHPSKNENLQPTDVTYGVDKKVWWICDRGHEYCVSVSSRTRHQSKCPYCNNKKVLKGFNDLESKYPDVAKEWHPTKNIGLVDGCGQDISTPDKVVFGAYRKVWWIGSCGHEYEAHIYHRAISHSGCPICNSKQVLQGFNDLATRYPEIAKEWHPTKNGDLKPSDVVARGNHKPWWLCPQGHSYQASLGGRTEGSGCPICDGKRVLPGFNDLATKYPNIAKEWHPTKNGKLTPKDVFAGGNKKAWWLGKCGHEYQTTIYNRVAQSTGCPYCSNTKVLVGFNDLLTTNPDIAAQWHPTKNGNLKPIDVTYGSGTYIWWLCNNGHEWKSQVLTRVSQSCGCPYCSGSKVWSGFNDLATKYPDLAKEWHPTKNGTLTAQNILAGGNKKAWWLGKCGHEWDASILDRIYGQNCPYCSGHRVLVGFNDLATKHPEIALEWHPAKNGSLTPCMFTCGSEKKAWWKCNKCHEWQASVRSRVKGNGCPICNKSRGEKAIRQVLSERKIQFREQTTFKDRKSSVGGLLKDDFAILYNKQIIATIEYNGEQHYYPIDFAGKGPVWADQQLHITQQRDKAKTQYLNEHQIPQLIIPYWEFDNIPTIVENFITTLTSNTKTYKDNLVGFCIDDLYYALFGIIA